MSLLEKATLITTPTAHSNGKLHSIKGGAVADFDVVRGSAATRVNAEGLIEDISVLSGELVTNGDFSNGSTDWSLGTGWSVSDGKAISDGSQTTWSIATQNLNSNAGQLVEVSFTLSDYVSGGLYVATGISDPSILTNANGTYTFKREFIGNSTLQLKADLNFIGSIDNISVVEVIDATNIPRIDYTTGEGVVLLEPQSTNLVTYSNELNQVGWSVSNSITITDNFDTSPDGTENALKWSNTASSFPQVGKVISGLTIGDSYTASFYVKSDGTSQNQISTQFTGSPRVDFTPTSEWVRITNTIVATATSHTFLLYINSGAAPASSFLVYGFQIEALSYATSYIPTSGAIATRLADSVTGAGDATTFNSTEGVLYFEGSAFVNGGTKRISLSDGSSSNRIVLTFANNTITYGFVSGGALSSNIVYNSDTTINKKYALTWKLNQFKFWVNGVQVGADTSGAVFPSNTLSEFHFADFISTASPFFGKVKALAVFNEALTDSELECLTKI